MGLCSWCGHWVLAHECIHSCCIAKPMCLCSCAEYVGGSEWGAACMFVCVGGGDNCSANRHLCAASAGYKL